MGNEDSAQRQRRVNWYWAHSVRLAHQQTHRDQRQRKHWAVGNAPPGLVPGLEIKHHHPIPWQDMVSKQRGIKSWHILEYKFCARLNIACPGDPSVLNLQLCKHGRNSLAFLRLPFLYLWDKRFLHRTNSDWAMTMCQGNLSEQNRWDAGPLSVQVQVWWLLIPVPPSSQWGESRWESFVNCGIWERLWLSSAWASNSVDL